MHFPPPTRKGSSPYRTAAIVVTASAVPRLVERSELIEDPTPIRRTPPRRATDIRRRLLAAVAGLGVTAVVLAAVVRAYELGARWPRAVLAVLAAGAVGCVCVLAWLRVRGLIRRSA
jgi:hypothetical protein